MGPFSLLCVLFPFLPAGSLSGTFAGEWVNDQIRSVPLASLEIFKPLQRVGRELLWIGIAKASSDKID